MTPEYTQVESIPPCKHFVFAPDGSILREEIITERPTSRAPNSWGLPGGDVAKTVVSGCGPRPQKPKVQRKPRPTKTPSIEALIECMNSEMSIAHIAEHFHVKYTVMMAYMAKARIASAEYRAAENHRRVCGCGAEKYPWAETCRECKKAATLCKIEGCGNRAKARELCSIHYWTFWKGLGRRKAAPCACKKEERAS